jgi:hypothetical protein
VEGGKKGSKKCFWEIYGFAKSPIFQEISQRYSMAKHHVGNTLYLYCLYEGTTWGDEDMQHPFPSFLGEAEADAVDQSWAVLTPSVSLEVL